jgi:hypothetical protein
MRSACDRFRGKHRSGNHYSQLWICNPAGRFGLNRLRWSGDDLLEAETIQFKLFGPHVSQSRPSGGALAVTTRPNGKNDERPAASSRLSFPRH